MVSKPLNDALAYQSSAQFNSLTVGQKRALARLFTALPKLAEQIEAGWTGNEYLKCWIRDTLSMPQELSIHWLSEGLEVHFVVRDGGVPEIMELRRRPVPDPL